jgi:hypothetical protein
MQTETMSRDRTFNMRLTPEEWARFEAVAADHELPVASVIRMLVKREADVIADHAALRARGSVTHEDVRWFSRDESRNERAKAALGYAPPRKRQAKTARGSKR